MCFFLNTAYQCKSIRIHVSISVRNMGVYVYIYIYMKCMQSLDIGVFFSGNFSTNWQNSLFLATSQRTIVGDERWTLVFIAATFTAPYLREILAKLCNRLRKI